MGLARFSLIAAAAGFGGFGVWLLAAPDALGAVGVSLTTPSAAIEIRGFYGGLEIGVAAFFALAAARPAWFVPALTVQVTALGGVVLGRLVGIVLDGSAQPLIYALMTLEIAGTLLGLTALAGLRRRAAGR